MASVGRLFICYGCQPNRSDSAAPRGAKHRAPAKHHCVGKSCMCPSCHQFNVVMYSGDEQYKNILTLLGESAIANVKRMKDALEGRHGDANPEGA